jgi:peptidoglycan-N-acetylglucosamine deacetylase
VAELLSKYGLRGTFYVPVENPKRPVMDAGAIRTLSSEFEIGAHSVHHSQLVQLSDEVAETEITAPKKVLEELTGKPCRMFCFPQGRFRHSQLRLVREAGFLGARTVELMSLDLPRTEDGVLVMPTTIQAYEHSRSEYFKNFGRRMALRNLLNYLSSSGNDWVEASEWFLREAIRRSGVFHLWGHSWEIDKFNLWPRLEHVFQKMAEVKNSARSADNSEVCEYALARRKTQDSSGSQPLPAVRR